LLEPTNRGLQPGGYALPTKIVPQQAGVLAIHISTPIASESVLPSDMRDMCGFSKLYYAL